MLSILTIDIRGDVFCFFMFFVFSYLLEDSTSIIIMSTVILHEIF